VCVCVCVCHTPNPLVYRLIVASPSRRTTSRLWKGRGYVTWDILIFWGTNPISGMAEARALKLCTKGDYTKSCQKDDKSPLKGAWFCSRDPFLYAQLKQNHGPFRSDLSSLWYDLIICSLFVPTLRALASAGTSYDQHVHQIWSLYVYSLRRYKADKNTKLGWFGGLGSPKVIRNIAIY